MKTDSMNQQWKREKAAELLGWKREKSPFTRDCTTIHNDISGEVWWHPDVAGCQLMAPLYDKDLNLMHEAEGVMDIDEKSDYADLLGRNDPIYGHDACMATAAQRLDAWLEVMMEEKR